MTQINDPKKIELESFKIIERYLKDKKIKPSIKPIIKRVIHATGDPSWAKKLIFHPKATAAGALSIKRGKSVVVDSNMVKAGINKNLLKKFNCKLICRLDSKRVIKSARKLHVTRSKLAMREAHKAMEGGIVVVGNAPTALFEVCALIRQKKAAPSLVVGVPVGFVGAIQAKRELQTLKVPFISNKSRRGGSAAAAAIMNALLIMAQKS